MSTLPGWGGYNKSQLLKLRLGISKESSILTSIVSLMLDANGSTSIDMLR